MMQALPGSPLEVVKTKFIFHLLVSLLANPTRLDGGCQGAQVGLKLVQRGLAIGFANSQSRAGRGTQELAL